MGCEVWPSVSQTLASNFKRQSLSTGADAESLFHLPESKKSGLLACCTTAMDGLNNDIHKMFQELTPFSQFIRQNY